MDEGEVAGKIEYEIVENIIGIVQSFEHFAVKLSTLNSIVSNFAPTTAIFIKANFDKEWVGFLKKFPEIFNLTNDIVSFSEYYINSNDFLKKCLTNSKFSLNSASIQGVKKSDKYKASATVFFQEVLSKVISMHYEKLFELLCTRSEKLLTNYFLGYSLAEMCKFFESRPNIFNISQSYVSLASHAICQNLKKHGSDFKTTHYKLQCGVIYLLKHFSPLHYAESIQCLSYVFDDIKAYLSKLSSLEHRALFANFLHLTMDECGFLSSKHSDADVLSEFSTFVTDGSKVILLLVTLLAFNGQIHFQKLINVVKEIHPTFFHDVTVSKQFSFFKKHNEFFSIQGHGYVRLLPNFVFHSFPSTSNNCSSSSTSDCNVTKPSCSSALDSSKQKRMVTMNSKGVVTKITVNGKTEKQLSKPSSPTLSNSHSFTERSSPSPSEALKHNGIVELNSKCTITNKTIFSKQTKKQLSDLLKENSLFNGDSHSVSNCPRSGKYAISKSVSCEVSVKCHQNFVLKNQSEEIPICQIKNCVEEENASESASSERKPSQCSTKKQSHLQEKIVSNCFPQTSTVKSTNLCSVPHVDCDESQSLNSSHPTGVDHVIKKLVDEELKKKGNFSTNYFITRVKDGVLYLSKYFTLTDHVFTLKSLLQVIDDVRDHFFQLGTTDQHDVIKSCKKFIDEELKSYAGGTNVSCISSREQYLLFISFVLLKHTRLHVFKIFEMLECNHTNFPVHLFTDADKMKYFQCLKKYFFVDNQGYAELNIFPEVAALSAELYCLIAPDLLKKIKNYEVDLTTEAEILSEMKQLECNEVFKHLPKSAVSNTIDICFIVLTISKKMYFKSLYSCLSHYGIPETREYFKALYFTDGCNIFQNIPMLFDVKCNYVKVKENVLVPYIHLREVYLSELMQQIHFFHTGYKNKHISFKMPYVSSDLVSFIERLSKKDYFSSFLANSLHSSPKRRANVICPSEGEKTQAEENVNYNCIAGGVSQFAKSAESNVLNSTDSKTEVGKEQLNMLDVVPFLTPEKILTCSEIEAKLRSEAGKSNNLEIKPNIVKNIILSPPPVSFSGTHSKVKEKIEALCSAIKFNSAEGAKADKTGTSDQHETSSLPVAMKHNEIHKEKALVSSKLPPNVLNTDYAISSNVIKQPVSEDIHKTSISDDKNKKFAHNSTVVNGNVDSLNVSSTSYSEELLPDEVMSGEKSYDDYCSALVDSVLGDASDTEKEDDLGGAKPKQRMNSSISPGACALVTSVTGLDSENSCTTMKRSRYFGANDSDSLYELRNTIEERAVNFFIVVLGSYDVGVPSNFLRKHLSFASLEVQHYMRELYTDDILPFFWRHKKIFYVSPYSQLIYLIKSCDASFAQHN